MHKLKVVIQEQKKRKHKGSRIDIEIDTQPLFCDFVHIIDKKSIERKVYLLL
jgi:hypothetical protein